MDNARPTPAPRADQRLLEGWLPLAAAANARYGWGLGGPDLEALIRQAAPQLRLATSALAAHAILWAAYHRDHSDEHP